MSLRHITQDKNEEILSLSVSVILTLTNLDREMRKVARSVSNFHCV